MQQFSYDSKPQDELVEDILHYHHKKLFRQQLVFTCIFVGLIVIIAVWLYRRVAYTYYDGYIELEQNHIRAIDDIFVVHIYHKTGAKVHAGDTLYSYVLMNNIMSQYDLHTLPEVVSDYDKMRAQAELARQDIPVLRVHLDELRKREASERNDIYYGLTNNTAQMALKAQINETEAQLREQMQRVALYDDLARRASARLGASGYGHDFIPNAPGTVLYNPLIKYCCAEQDGTMTDVKVAEQTVVFKKEDVVWLQHDDYRSCNLGVMAYVPSNQVKNVVRRRNVEVVVNDEIVLNARLSMIGIRVDEIPRHLVSNFAHDVDAVVAYFTLNPYQKVPAWVLTDHLPVRVRTLDLAPADTTDNQRMMYIERSGDVVPWDSLQYRTIKTRKP